MSRFAIAGNSLGGEVAWHVAAAWLCTRILPRRVVESSVRKVYGNPSLVTDSLVTHYCELTLREGNRGSLPRRFAQSCNGTDSAVIATLRASTLVMWGGPDGLIPPDHAGRFARDIVGSRIELFPELGHVPHKKDPVRTAAVAAAFRACPRC